MNKFPYSNFHDINLDWIVSMLRKAVFTVNGQEPDEKGDINLPTVAGVSSVNGVGPDGAGNISLTPADVGALPDTYTAPVQSVQGKTGNVLLSASDVNAMPSSFVPPVQSVNGQTDNVVLTASDVGALPDTYTAPVDSVNGMTGIVVLGAADVNALPDTTVIPTTTSQLINDSGYVTSLEVGAVLSVNGMTGNVELTANDIPYDDQEVYDQDTIGNEISKNSNAISNNSADIANMQTQILSMYPVDTESGATASFSDGANNIPMVELIVTMVPNQEGSGDPAPDNVRAITGIDIIKVWIEDIYDISANPTISIVIPTPPGTVYSGTLDVVSGVLTIDKVFVRFADVTWSKWTDSQTGKYGFYFTPSDSKTSDYTGDPDFLCSMFKPVQTGTRTTFIRNGADKTMCHVATSKAFYVIDNDYSDQNAFASAVENGQIVYELDTPQTYQLTPIEVTTLFGDNVVWSDAGDVDVTYRADIQKYIQKLT